MSLADEIEAQVRAIGSLVESLEAETRAVRSSIAEMETRRIVVSIDGGIGKVVVDAWGNLCEIVLDPKMVKHLPGDVLGQRLVDTISTAEQRAHTVLESVTGVKIFHA